MPVAVTMPAGVTFTTVAAGASHSLALDTAGRAWAWGDNVYGQLGSGTNATGRSSTPVAVTMPAGVTFTTVAAGGYHSLALDTAGRAWAWGDNVEGALGNGTNTGSGTPVPVTMPAGVTFTTV